MPNKPEKINEGLFFVLKARGAFYRAANHLREGLFFDLEKECWRIIQKIDELTHLFEQETRRMASLGFGLTEEDKARERCKLISDLEKIVARLGDLLNEL